MISLLKRHNVDYNNICEFIADTEVDINTADEQIEKILGGTCGTHSAILVIDTNKTYYKKSTGEWVAGGDGVPYNIGHGLKVDTETNTLSVDTVSSVEQDNTLPITSAAVYAEVGNINALLGTI